MHEEDAFISHASEDQEAFVRRLASGEAVGELQVEIERTREELDAARDTGACARPCVWGPVPTRVRGNPFGRHRPSGIVRS